MRNSIFNIIVFVLEHSPFQKQINSVIPSLGERALFRKRPFADLLIEVLYRRQCYEEIADVYKNLKVSNKLFTSNLIKSLIKRNELDFLGLELEKYLDHLSLERSKSFHVYEMVMASIDYPNERRTELRNERIVNLRVGNQEREIWQNILITNGLLWKIDELDAQESLADSVSERVRELKDFQGELLLYTKIAGQNNCMPLHEKIIVNGRRHIAYNKLADKCVIELNIPATFFFLQNDENTKSVRRYLIEFYLHLIEDFIENEIPFMPVLQFGWNVSPLVKENYVFSHHTRGGGQRHFHIKTSAIKGFVSFDNNGFAGWASVAEENSQYRERIDQISEALSEQTWKKAFNDIVVKNYSKYAQPDPVKNGYTFQYIFLPLQIAVDLVASLSYITGHDLASFLVDKFRGSRYKVVIKRHPLCICNKTKELLERLGKENHVIISSNSIHELIKNASLVVTVNSGVGMEAILHLKNVVITGRADYFYGATLVKTKEDLEKYLDSVVWEKKNDVKLKKFIHFYFNDFLIEAGIRDQVSTRIRSIGL